MSPLHNYRIRIPNQSNEYWVKDADLENAQVGDALTLRRHTQGLGLSLNATATDAGTTLVITIKAKGLDQFGVRKTDTITVDTTGGSPKTTYGAQVFEHLEKVEITAITGNGASDTLSVGSAISPGNTRVALPLYLKTHATNKSAQQSLAAYGTVTIQFMDRNNVVDANDFTINDSDNSFQHALMAVGDEYIFRFGWPWED